MKLTIALLLLAALATATPTFTSATAQDGALTCTSTSSCQLLPDLYSGASSAASEDGNQFHVSAYVGSSNFVYVQAGGEASYAGAFTFTGATGDGIATLTFQTGVDILACCDSLSGVEEHLSVTLGQTTEQYAHSWDSWLPVGNWTIAAPFTFGQPVTFDVDLSVLAATRVSQAAGDYGFEIASIGTTDMNGVPIEDGVTEGSDTPEPDGAWLVALGFAVIGVAVVWSRRRKGGV
jgi:ABC-type amino acid transport substrate-binding protein